MSVRIPFEASACQPVTTQQQPLDSAGKDPFRKNPASSSKSQSVFFLLHNITLLKIVCNVKEVALQIFYFTMKY